MSGFGFLDDELNEASGSLATKGDRKPPTNWGAAKSKSRFEDSQQVADYAGGGGGGGGGPSLPFRIREVQIVPKAIGTTPVFAVAKPRLKD
mmetsp:Transcript_79688/g.204998  ORF Transcript_79688/g.204998 Transcript_79688/m.204998 type:complete len:91 (+) Transcript_79688:119-391(+)